LPLVVDAQAGIDATWQIFENSRQGGKGKLPPLSA